MLLIVSSKWILIFNSITLSNLCGVDSCIVARHRFVAGPIKLH